VTEEIPLTQDSLIFYYLKNIFRLFKGRSVPSSITKGAWSWSLNFIESLGWKRLELYLHFLHIFSISCTKTTSHLFLQMTAKGQRKVKDRNLLYNLLRQILETNVFFIECYYLLSWYMSNVKESYCFKHHAI
jgi:hypothetical protein